MNLSIMQGLGPICKENFDFDSENPFPLVSPAQFHYGKAKEHAISVDKWLGFETGEIENSLREMRRECEKSRVELGNNENWSHLDVQAFSTTYIEIRSFLEILRLSPGERLIDLGCGYARTAFVMHRHFPQCQFFGYELESHRVREAQRVARQIGMPLQVWTQDLSAKDFRLPEASAYFIYDYGPELQILNTLEAIRLITNRKKEPISLVARGRRVQQCIQSSHPWMFVKEPIHLSTFSVYRF